MYSLVAWESPIEGDLIMKSAAGRREIPLALENACQKNGLQKVYLGKPLERMA